MSSSSSILSQTLQSITAIKLRELLKQRETFNSRKKSILVDVENATDEELKVRLLLSGLARMHASGAGKSLEELQGSELEDHLGDLSLSNIRRFSDQSKYDPSMTSSLLEEFADDLHKILDRKTRRFDYADLYSRLLTEWLESDASSPMDVTAPENDPSDGTFEMVETQKTRLQQLSEKFESIVFTPLEVNAAKIEDLLTRLFSDEEATMSLHWLRTNIKRFGDTFAAKLKPFDHDVLRWCINGLLQSDLLSDQKQNTLKDFLQDDVVLTEIEDVLNMRFADLEGWEWDADNGIPVEPRRQLNGKYRVVMDEDILQSIFLHYISVSWSVQFKMELTDIIRNPHVWKKPQSLPSEESERREYYLGQVPNPLVVGLADLRQNTYTNSFFMCQLPSDVKMGAKSYDDEDKKGSLNMKQELLRTLGSEVIIRRALYGEVAVVRSDLQWFATSTSHLAVTTILKFFGVPQIWMSFFQRYLEAPLRMVGLEGSSGEVRTRKRGVPIGHVFQKLFGELIIFAMDLAVNQEAGMLLYRLHDDLWLCGEPEKCAKAWTAMERCAAIMGVEFNESKTGSVYLPGDSANKDLLNTEQTLAVLPKGKIILGFLELDPKTGDWIIDQTQVDAHVQQLKKQLKDCHSVFSWIQTWNSCIGRFFNYTFGQPANCFGRRHVDMILETHGKIQQVLFRDASVEGNSVTEYLKNLITKRFGVLDVPDAFLYFPEELGGLGLRNPFISFLVIREQLVKDPQATMAEFFESEREHYKRTKQEFDALSENERKRRMSKIWDTGVGKVNKYVEKSNDPHEILTCPHDSTKHRFHDRVGKEFMTFEDFTCYRETLSYHLRATYLKLLQTPSQDNVRQSWHVSHALQNLALAQPKLAWDKLSADQKWIIQLYSTGVLERFGGLNLVDRGLLPMGIMTMLRARKVTWQAVL